MKRLFVVLVAVCSIAFPTTAYAESVDDSIFVDEQVDAVVYSDDSIDSFGLEAAALGEIDAPADSSVFDPNPLDPPDPLVENSEDISSIDSDVNHSDHSNDGSELEGDPSVPDDPSDPSFPEDHSDPTSPNDPTDSFPTGWQDVDGARFYIDPDSGERFAGGVFEIDGESYCFDPEGILVTGWMTIDGDVYWFDPETGIMATGCDVLIQGMCAPVTTADGSSFSDVTASTPHADDIAWTLNSGVSSGWVSADGSRSFRPLASVARADMAAFLYRIVGSPDYLPTDEDTAFFTDVNPDTPHAMEVWWLANAKISEGWTSEDGTHTFRPYSSVARADMAAFLYRLAGSPDLTATEGNIDLFSDVTSEVPHSAEIGWLAGSGISDGWLASDGTRSFRPYSAVARADMAAFLRRTFSLDYFEAEGEHRYLFTDDGALVTGWADDGNFYSYSTGARVEEGWIVDGADRSYLDPDSGELLKDCLSDIAGYYYLFDESGHVLHGWTEVDGAKRCFSPETGFMYVDGIYKVDGARFGFSDDGSMIFGWAEFDGSKYYFNLSTGKMVYGITTIDGSMYWFDSSTGKMRTSGRTIINQSVYEVGPDGKLVKSTYGQRLATATAAQKRLAALAWKEPTTPSGWCALWVHNVFEAFGIYDVYGNANDLYYDYCTSSDPLSLQVGMIVAVSRHPGTSGGRIYGHIGIYVGDGIMLDSSGSVRVWNVEDWINSYNGWVTPKWGWYGNRKLG